MWKDNLKVGKPDVKMDAPAHTPGVNAGNEPGGIEGDPGIYYTGENQAGRPTAKATMRLPDRPEQPGPAGAVRTLAGGAVGAIGHRCETGNRA
jgi:hypothetical protein